MSIELFASLLESHICAFY